MALQLSAQGLGDAEEGSDDLRDVLRRMSRDDAVWWPSCSLPRWGYLAEFVAVTSPDQYVDVMKLAHRAVQPREGAETEIIEYGPLAVSAPQRFQMRIPASPRRRTRP
jgi:hypothetical protein